MADFTAAATTRERAVIGATAHNNKARALGRWENIASPMDAATFPWMDSEIRRIILMLHGYKIRMILREMIWDMLESYQMGTNRQTHYHKFQLSRVPQQVGNAYLVTSDSQ
jgi:hypothetical protein